MQKSWRPKGRVIGNKTTTGGSTFLTCISGSAEGDRYQRTPKADRRKLIKMLDSNNSSISNLTCQRYQLRCFACSRTIEIPTAEAHACVWCGTVLPIEWDAAHRQLAGAAAA